MIHAHPLPQLAPLLDAAEHANFFEARATEYSKAATRGNWNDVWDSGACRGAGEADRRKNAKAANDGEGLAADSLAQAGGDDMFTRARVAAE